MSDFARHHGHVIDALHAMGVASVQCIATSPPYFGLRDYGLEPVIWEPVVFAPMSGLPEISVPSHADPEAFAHCEHDWTEWTQTRSVREEGVHGKTRTTDRFYGNESRRFNGNHQKHAHGQYCRHCGAWRGCLGLEADPNLYIGHLVQVFREAWRVLADDGVLWLNLGDSYARNGGTDKKTPTTANVGSTLKTLAQVTSRKQSAPTGLKSKDLIGIPWRAALALQADGWYLRSDVVWAKGISLVEGWSGNPMPESVTDRPTRAHEMVFLLSKRERYFYDHVAVREKAEQSATDAASSFKRADSKRRQGIPTQPVGTHRPDRADVKYNQATRNLRDVWGITTTPYPGAHFAVWPGRFVRPMILAGTSEAGHCPQCGKRWVRQTQKCKIFASGSAMDGRSLQAIRDGGKHGGSVNDGNLTIKAGPVIAISTTGWRPQCTCGLDPVPDVVLDLFGGSGTTAAVAIELGRHAVLIDANADFSPLQDQRIAKARLPVTARKTGARKGAPEKQAALFDVVGLPHAAQDAAAPMWEDALC